MIEISALLIGLLIALLAVVNLIVFFAWKRSDVSVIDGMFTFGIKHKGIWWWKQPELYFKEDRAQSAKALLCSFFVLLLIACLLCPFIIDLNEWFDLFNS